MGMFSDRFGGENVGAHQVGTLGGSAAVQVLHRPDRLRLRDGASAWNSVRAVQHWQCRPGRTSSARRPDASDQRIQPEHVDAFSEDIIHTPKVQTTQHSVWCATAYQKGRAAIRSICGGNLQSSVSV